MWFEGTMHTFQCHLIPPLEIEPLNDFNGISVIELRDRQRSRAAPVGLRLPLDMVQQVLTVTASLDMNATLIRKPI